MNRRNIKSARAVVGIAAVACLAVTGTASADPTSTPGVPPSGLTPSQIYAGVGADAFAELTNNVADQYDAQVPAPTVTLASYDAINPVTGAAGEQITTKPGCTIARPNGANAGVSAIISGLKSTVDTNSYCIDFVRSSRAKGSASGEQQLTFYAQSRDAVSYATVGNAYAPVAPLTTAQLKDIFECTTTDWADVGGQPGEIHLYLPPTSAATYTFFLQAIGSSVANVGAGCGTTNPRVFASQQNDGRTLNGDPQGITPYAVTKWAAQENEPAGRTPGTPAIQDLRGGAQIGLVNTTVQPTISQTLGGTTYQVLNPAFTGSTGGVTNPSASFGRLFFNVVRNGAPQDLKDVFNSGGYVCAHANDFLVPFGNTPLGTQAAPSPDGRYCGQES